MVWSEYENENDDVGSVAAPATETTELGFDVGSIDVAPVYELVPPGRYRVCVTSAKVVPSKKTATTVLAQIEETICEEDSPLRGRKIWSRYVVAHADGTVMARGRQDVARMMTAYSVGGNNIAPLVGREAIAAVEIQPAKGEFEPSNRIRRREPVGQSAPVGPTTSATPAPAKAKASAPSFLARRKQAAQNE